ncbi:RHS repeat protein [Pseudomonas putida]|uniref:RHS repeat protein n=1 Tax=Pseudomonas putida TaxID=303 RepID=A0A4D6XCJ0_PSEPU|nr:RHS repeat domain-containing protein [Pseudomonas putida]QCI12111.1 RHS repeat protein [Pseudomonas putida]
MPVITHKAVHRNTPTVTVRDNRGLTVREISYHRHPEKLQQTDTRITRHRYDARGFKVQSSDPRLHAAGLNNFTWQYDLGGQPLRTRSVDTGVTVQLADAAGRPRMAVTQVAEDELGHQDRSQAVTRTWHYETATRLGRPLGISEQVEGQPARRIERCVYAGNSAAEQAVNLAGQVSLHFDTAGLTQTHAITLTGVPQRITRRLLADADDPLVTADWQGSDIEHWMAALQPPEEGASSTTSADATGAVLTSTDAAGNVQEQAYDVAGLLKSTWLTLKDSHRQDILKAMSYSAAGQKLHEEHGNGLITRYRYEPRTQRLAGIRTERPQGHTLGAKVLQDLRYTYDAVGNVLKVRDDAEAIRFWRNQKIEPECTYSYDSLYQLASATGREMANAARQGRQPPERQALDNATLTQYTRTYDYDSAGNLMRIRHSAPASGNSYTLDITISDRSNRGVVSALTEDPAQVDRLFTPGGMQRVLAPGQRLAWTPRGELHSVAPVTREGGVSDQESYRYDIGNQRILKVSSQLHAGTTQRHRVLYLPGLELRRASNDDRLSEDLQVASVVAGDAAQVRALRWISGKPDDIDNDQLRYAYADHLGSASLEVDGEGAVISQEVYYPFGGTAAWAARSEAQGRYKTVRYSGKERDATGLYYYGFRYYQPWAGRWLSADPAGTVDGLNLYGMVRGNPMTLCDPTGLEGKKKTLGAEGNRGGGQAAGQDSPQVTSPTATDAPTTSGGQSGQGPGSTDAHELNDDGFQVQTKRGNKSANRPANGNGNSSSTSTSRPNQTQRSVETSAEREAREHRESLAMNGQWDVTGSPLHERIKQRRGSLPDDLLAVGQRSSEEGIGALVYMVTGRTAAKGQHQGEGASHILEEHGSDVKKAGIAADQITPLIMTALVSGKEVGINSPAASNAIVHKVNFGNTDRLVTIVMRGNSVLTAYPFTKRKPFPFLAHKKR